MGSTRIGKEDKGRIYVDNLIWYCNRNNFDKALVVELFFGQNGYEKVCLYDLEEFLLNVAEELRMKTHMKKFTKALRKKIIEVGQVK